MTASKPWSEGQGAVDRCFGLVVAHTRRLIHHKSFFGDFCANDRVPQSLNERTSQDCFLQSENLAGPKAADQIRPHIVRDRAVRAWLGKDGGRATLAARLNSCSQPSAELFVLLLETGQSLYTAFFNDKISL
jgi:hypothetical protein